MNRKPLILAGLIVLFAAMVFAAWIYSRPGFDIVELPDRMAADVVLTDAGYNVSITDVGDYDGQWMGLVNLSVPISWKVWDATEMREVAGGNINSSAIVNFTDANDNGIMDAGDYFEIADPAHSYTGYYFIVNYPEDEGVSHDAFIHEPLP